MEIDKPQKRAMIAVKKEILVSVSVLKNKETQFLYI